MHKHTNTKTRALKNAHKDEGSHSSVPSAPEVAVTGTVGPNALTPDTCPNATSSSDVPTDLHTGLQNLTTPSFVSVTSETSVFPVSILRCNSYTTPCAATSQAPPVQTDEHSYGYVSDAVQAALQNIGYKPQYGSRVLLKPNLLAPSEDGLCCTHPQVVAAACDYVTAHGAAPVVGDSPAFGSAMRVAHNIGLDILLKKRGVELITLEHPRSITLPCGLTTSISRHALDTDAILNIPRLKAHSQFRITCGMKNLFGCVSGVRKALAHSKHGDRQNAFRNILIEIHDVLPPVTSLLDGIVVMDGTGPSGGDPFPLGVIAASSSTSALDTAAYMMVRTMPESIPLWNELRLRGAPAAFRRNLHFPQIRAEQIDGSAFRFPHALKPETFNPARLLRSAIKRFVMRYLQ